MKKFILLLILVILFKLVVADVARDENTGANPSQSNVTYILNTTLIGLESGNVTVNETCFQINQSFFCHQFPTNVNINISGNAIAPFILNLRNTSTNQSSPAAAAGPAR